MVVEEEEEGMPTSGVLTSPDYPQPYPKSHDSTQTIQVAEGKTIRWASTHLDTEPSRYDYVQIFDLIWSIGCSFEQNYQSALHNLQR